MSTNRPDLRPDRAPAPRIGDVPRPGQPTVGMVSLGCPKALVDSERILTRLRAEGYGISPDYAGADAVIVITAVIGIIVIFVFEAFYLQHRRDDEKSAQH